MSPLESLPAITDRLGVDPDSFKFLRYSQNAVYEFVDAAGVVRILRITAGSHRSLPEILNELAWVRHLHGAGVDVCPPVAFEDGSMVCSASNAAGVFHTVVFQKAAGRPLAKADLTTELYHAHGRHLGGIPAVGKGFPQEVLGRRKPWDAERYFTSDIDLYLPKEVREPMRAVFRDLQARLNALPASRDSFGPIHGDLGYANLHLDGDRLESFDFDNCSNGHFVSDIAAALYGSIFTGLRCEFPGDRAAFESPRSGRNLEKVWAPFREGYRSKNEWLAGWDEQLELCFEIMYFRSVVHAFRLQHPVTHPTAKAALDADVANILSRQMPLRFDFTAGKALM